MGLQDLSHNLKTLSWESYGSIAFWYVRGYSTPGSPEKSATSGKSDFEIPVIRVTSPLSAGPAGPKSGLSTGALPQQAFLA